MTEIIIIGAGPAGMNAIDTIRELGSDANVTLVCDEPPYSRMVLPYFMAGDITEQHVMTADEGYLQAMGVTHRQARVAGVDANGKTVSLDGGESLPYDALLVATGASAVRPPIPGTESAFNLWTLADAKGVLAQLPGREAVIIGGGFIGFTCLDAIARHASKVTVIELAPHILPRMVDEACARFGEDWLRSRGIEVVTGAEVERAANGSVGTKDGREFRADVLITATGIRPNLVEGIPAEEGIVVDDHMRTSLDGVFAAGDCAQGPDLVTGRTAVHAIQPTATDHGRVAAANICGTDVTYPGSLAVNVLEVQDYTLASFGDWSRDDDAFTTANISRGVYRKLLWDGTRLVGAILAGPTKDIGLVNDLGMAKGLIQSREEIGAWKDHLRSSPLDLRRAYIGAGVAPKLLQRTLLGRPSTGKGYRYPPAAAPAPWPAHDVFVRSKPSA